MVTCFSGRPKRSMDYPTTIRWSSAALGSFTRRSKIVAVEKRGLRASFFVPAIPSVAQGSNRCIAALLTFRGNALPLFWHCRFAAARKALIYGLRALGTRLAMSSLRKIWSKVSRHEHQLR
ncbi:hypothetical protein EMIT0196P_80070 [Pseudomonas chlororaphis]